MIVNLNLNQILEYRRIAAGLRFLRTDCTVERVDGIDVDSTAAASLRLRYLQLLDTAPAHLLPTADIASQIAVSAYGTAYLPASCRRLLNIRLSHWRLPAFPVSRADFNLSPRRRRVLNRYCAPGPVEPLAVTEPDGSLSLWPFSPSGSVVRAIAVIDPGENSFSLDESLLPSLIQIPES